MFMRSTRNFLLGALPVIVAVTFAGSGLASADASVDQQAQPATAMVVQGDSYETAIAGFSFGATPANAAISQDAELSMSQDAELSGASPVSDAATPVVSEAAAVSDVIDSQLNDVATDPKAEHSDPVLNGALAGAGIGALATLVNCIPSVIVLGVGYPICLLLGVLPHAAVGAIIGGIVGHANPEVIPQVLP
ncbi:hypothetical protein FEK33_24840 [Nocardia asteroides NBRC 15531]|uniref:Secreted protein n=1 Tax=Nocardia asteroides NBRC 15531 TaxID=1110697 RepID=U5EI41_NOCAS|nr:hypothetical protein [Nocardia asteroides]TLF63286.1 hypothetical protein FEK33_24840 [Nocardia asteroides NBRC 15531]UGT47300.1 hypothetical protein LT345_22695 [Nocardia asteroides]GAD86965.1 hypothetical protein NCAST_34_00930 [Nocardia asteroides NBRC 15531]